MSEQGDWNEYQRLVMGKLESLEKGQHETNAKLNQLTTDMEVTKVKAGLWGFLAGAIPAALAMLIHLLKPNR